MTASELSAAIGRKALELGYNRCGIIRIQDMKGYAEKLAKRSEEYPGARPLLDQLAGFADAKMMRPWAESIVVLAKSFGHYAIPEHLRGQIASAYLCNWPDAEGTVDYRNKQAFGDYLKALGIRAETDTKAGLTAARFAAMQAGIGTIRKNNFLYTEDGSFVYLTGWLIDTPLEHKENTRLKPCPEGCRKCIDACPAKAMKGPYSMHPFMCISFKTGLGGDDLTTDPQSASMGSWIFGCDLCQLACPFNNASRKASKECPGLADFSRKVSLTQIIDMNYDELEELFAARFWYISKERLWKWKVNVLNAMKNQYKSEFLPWILKARNDSAEQVRNMAKWVLEGIDTDPSKEFPM